MPTYMAFSPPSTNPIDPDHKSIPTACSLDNKAAASSFQDFMSFCDLSDDNGDGDINITDINFVIHNIMGNHPQTR